MDIDKIADDMISNSQNDIESEFDNFDEISDITDINSDCIEVCGNQITKKERDRNIICSVAGGIVTGGLLYIGLSTGALTPKGIIKGFAGIIHNL